MDFFTVNKRDFNKRDFILPQLNNTIKKYNIPLINLFSEAKYYKAQCKACRAARISTGRGLNQEFKLNHSFNFKLIV